MRALVLCRATIYFDGLSRVKNFCLNHLRQVIVWQIIVCRGSSKANPTTDASEEQWTILFCLAAPTLSALPLPARAPTLRSFQKAPPGLIYACLTRMANRPSVTLARADSPCVARLALRYQARPTLWISSLRAMGAGKRPSLQSRETPDRSIRQSNLGAGLTGRRPSSAMMRLPATISKSTPRIRRRGIPKCVVIESKFDWEGDCPPDLPLADSIVYEVHVRGFSIRNPAVPENLRGTYAGLAHRSEHRLLQEARHYGGGVSARSTTLSTRDPWSTKGSRTIGVTTRWATSPPCPDIAPLATRVDR